MYLLNALHIQNLNKYNMCHIDVYICIQIYVYSQVD